MPSDTTQAQNNCLKIQKKYSTAAKPTHFENTSNVYIIFYYNKSFFLFIKKTLLQLEFIIIQVQ